MTPTDIRDTAIPEDVMEAARAVLLEEHSVYWDDFEEISEVIARAIMAAIEAERERCAKIAEADVPKDCSYGPGMGIAAAIRAGTKGASHD